MSAIEAATLVDAHVHLVEPFDLGAQLDAACGNLERAAGGLGLGLAGGVLLLAQRAGEERFETLAAAAATTPASRQAAAGDGWSVRRTAEPESLLAARAGAPPLFLVCGRQVVTAERLEVLALATVQRFRDGRPIAEILAVAGAAGALVVLPWGVGKWLGRRGERVRALIEGGSVPAVADTGNRPALWPRPRLLKLAEARGLRDLRGSDPLPLPSETGRAGGYGFAVRASLSPERPAADLKRRLADRGLELLPFGKPEAALRFVRNQALLRRRRD